MKTKIIFRGKRLDNGEIVTGHGVYFDPPHLKLESWTWIITDEFPLVVKNWHRVEPDSVAMIQDEEIEQ